LNARISLALWLETELVEAFPPVDPALVWIVSKTASEFGFVGLTVTLPSAAIPAGVVSVATPTTEMAATIRSFATVVVTEGVVWVVPFSPLPEPTSKGLVVSTPM